MHAGSDGLVETDRRLAEVLRGETLDLSSVEDALQRAQVHGVCALLADVLRSRGEMNTAPAGLEAVLAGHQVFEKLHGARVREVLDRLGDAGLDVIVLKGAALAHLVYSRPFLRSRGDTDLLVDPKRFEEAARVFASLGYVRRIEAGRGKQSHQGSFVLEDTLGARHEFDVHRAISNRQVFARAFTWNELWGQTMALYALHPQGRALSPIYLMLHACLHRVAHLHSPYLVNGVQHRGDRLIWLWDIARLADTMVPADWISLGLVAKEKALARVVQDGLQCTLSVFPCAVPGAVLQTLGSVRGEASARLLGVSGARVMLEDLQAVPGWREKCALLKDVFFPPAAYMDARYGAAGVWRLPWRYLHRGLTGLLRHLRRPS